MLKTTKNVLTRKKESGVFSWTNRQSVGYLNDIEKTYFSVIKNYLLLVNKYLHIKYF